MAAGYVFDGAGAASVGSSKLLRRPHNDVGDGLTPGDCDIVG